MTWGFATRPEARWALWTAALGAAGTAAVLVKAIFASTSSTSAIGFVFVPFFAAVAGIPFGVWGMAVGHVVARLRGRVAEPWFVFAVALVAAAALPAAAGLEAWRGTQLERAVREALVMDAPALDRALAESPWRDDKFFLGALAQNPAASAQLLERLASTDDPALYESLGSLWDVKGANLKGLPVMRLVMRHPNTPPAALARLEANPRAKDMLFELLANPNTPAEVIARHAGDADDMAQWGLALNPRAPRDLLERLAKSPNRYTRLNITYNKGAPRELLEALARDADEIVARNAAQALERRRD